MTEQAISNIKQRLRKQTFHLNSRGRLEPETKRKLLQPQVGEKSSEEEETNSPTDKDSEKQPTSWQDKTAKGEKTSIQK